MNTEIIIAVVVVAVLALALKGKKKDKKPGAPSGGPDWRIGPIVNGRNYSVGMPARPATQGQGWAFDFPTNPSQHVHYVQWFNPPSLVGKREIRIRYRITGGGFVPQESDKPGNDVSSIARIGLLIQRRGDDWGEAKEAYRWFSLAGDDLAAGEFELAVPLTPDHWKSTLGKGTPGQFTTATHDLDNIAILFGSNGGRGHGVYAKQPSRFTLLSIAIT